MAALELRRLDPEPWGTRLGRARKAAGLNVRQVEEILFPHISKSALIRLEAQPALPEDRKDRARAALVLLLYGFDGDDFGLDRADVPPAIDRRALGRLARRRRKVAPPSTKWKKARPLLVVAA